MNTKKYKMKRQNGYIVSFREMPLVYKRTINTEKRIVCLCDCECG